MGAAALPAGPSEHRGDGVLQPLVGIGGYQLHSAEPPSGQRPQEGQPERAVLAGAHVHTQDLTLPFGIDPRRHHHADVIVVYQCPFLAWSDRDESLQC